MTFVMSFVTFPVETAQGMSENICFSCTKKTGKAKGEDKTGKTEARQKTSCSNTFGRTQIRWVIWLSSKISTCTSIFSTGRAFGWIKVIEHDWIRFKMTWMCLRAIQHVKDKLLQSEKLGWKMARNLSWKIQGTLKFCASFLRKEKLERGQTVKN